MKKYRYSNRLLYIFIFLLILIIISVALFFKVRPVICNVAHDRSDDLLSAAANEGIASALATGKYSYDKLTVVSRSSEGKILGIELNTVQINALKLDIVDGINKVLAGKTVGRFSLPIGTLLGSQYTNGFGPRVRIPYEVSTTSALTFDNQFLSVGINQSLHRIYICITFHACLMTVGSTEHFTVSLSVPVAQTVIVGEVPESYTTITDGSGEHVVDNIINFADRK